MENELDIAIKNLKKNLDVESKDQIDEISFKKDIYYALRESLKNKKEILIIGSYAIRLSPERIIVAYHNDYTNIEISNNYNRFDTERDTETKYFVLSNIENDEFDGSTPAFCTYGTILNLDGNTEEDYEFDLLNPTDGKRIKDYFELPKEFEFYDDEYFNNPNSIVIKRKGIKRSDKRINLRYLFKDNVVPVKYDPIKNKYYRDEERYEPSDYSLLLPQCDKIQEILSFIYNTIVEFYTDYINNQ